VRCFPIFPVPPLLTLHFTSPTVKRVIVLSSCAAVLQQTSSPATYDETSWNEPAIAEVREKGAAASPFVVYRASKTLAERAAWDFVEKNKDAIGWDLVVLNPPFVWGVRLAALPPPLYSLTWT
jgi:nucleoside-diphosphate-sugar epimerase